MVFPVPGEDKRLQSGGLSTSVVPTMSESAIDTPLEKATDAFIAKSLPAWLKSASHGQFETLRSSFQKHVQSQQQVQKAFAKVKPLDGFATSLLEARLLSSLSLTVELDKAQWREERRTQDEEWLTGLRPYFVRMPALQRFLQNFKDGEPFFEQTGLVYPGDGSTGQAEQVLTTDSAQLVTLCRELDVGTQYQQHLDSVLDADCTTTLTEDKRLQLALAIEIAALKNQLEADDLDMLRRVIADKPATHAHSDRVYAGALQVLGYRVEGALAFERQDVIPVAGSVPRTSVQGVIIFLPGDPVQTLRAFASWHEASLCLGKLLRDPGYQREFNSRIALSDRPEYLETLRKRLADKTTDATASCEVIHDPLFHTLATQQLQRIRDNARFLAVPTAQADARASAERWQMLETAGLTVFNLAGLFVPAVAALLAAGLVSQTLSEVCEGVQDWSLDHQHEAIDHMLGVAETLLVSAALAAGTVLVARGFTRSEVLDDLAPVLNDAGESRLWSGDLTPYEDSAPPDGLIELDNGLLSDGYGHWWRNGETYYQVRSVTGRSAWQLRHPQREAGFGPLLEFNGERCWQLSTEHPLEWTGTALLLGRLWPPAARLSSTRIAQILKVADVDEEHLRGLLVERRPLPVELRDSLERFAVDARLDTFFEQLGEGREDDSEVFQWCIEALKVATLSIEEQRAEFLDNAPALREQLLEHFSRQYLAKDPLLLDRAQDRATMLALIQRDFKGLPEAYALDVLKRTTDTQRQRMLTEQRLPLAVAEHARAHLQLAKLTRIREGLYLKGSYKAETVAVVFALLRKHARLAGAADIELREGSDTGRVLARLYPDNDPKLVTVVLVRGEGSFACYDPQGHELDTQLDNPDSLVEVLARHLPSEDLKRLTWDGAGARDQITSALRTWLPSGRKALVELAGLGEIKPRYSSLQRLPDGRIGYLLSGRGEGSHPSRRLLLSAMRTLYPTLGARALDNVVVHLLETPETAYIRLTQQYREYRQLDEALDAWVGPERVGNSAVVRRLFADELRRSWRLEGRRLVTPAGQPAGHRLSLIGMELRSLPTLPANADFNHITELTLVGLHLDAIPAGFLRCFSRVRWLNLSNNALVSVPVDIEHLAQLTTLRLSQNRIRMTEAAVQSLRNLSQLHTLDLSFNPLGAISLEFRQLSRLRELSLRRANLQAVPIGLEWCGLLEMADLRDNQISTLPDALLTAPLETRRAVELRNNPLAAQMLVRLHAPDPVPVVLPPAVVVQTQVRAAWLATLEAAASADREAQWDALQAEPGSDEFFRLLGDLTETSDFRQARQDLSRRVWALIESTSNDQKLREEVFDLAGERGCVDRVISCFSTLEVRMLVAQALHGHESANEQVALLQLARGLFRLEKVERIARLDIERRVTLEADRLLNAGFTQENATARARAKIDEVEVSLAYRIGLARTLDLPGQPKSMQFGHLAGVTQQQLHNAAASVRWASATDELVTYVMQRDFWTRYLEREHRARFEQVKQPFWKQQEALHEMPEGEMLARSVQINKDFKKAVEGLIEQLTREALRTLPADD